MIVLGDGVKEVLADDGPRLIVVTGWRRWADVTGLHHALAFAGEGAARVLMFNGQGDPQLWVAERPRRVPWAAAERGPARPYVGADWLADRYALTQGWERKHFPADWTRFGDAAGPIRNATMIDHAVAADAYTPLMVAAPHGLGWSGTRGCMALAARAGIPIIEVKGD